MKRNKPKVQSVGGRIRLVLAVLLLTPPVQSHLYRIMGRRFDEQGRPRDPNVIEGEFVRMDHEKLPRTDSDQT